MIPDAERCAKRVRTIEAGQAYFHRHDARGTVAEDGKLWCRQHAPSLLKAHYEERNAQRRAGYEANQRREVARTRRLQAGEDALALLPEMMGAFTVALDHDQLGFVSASSNDLLARAQAILEALKGDTP